MKIKERHTAIIEYLQQNYGKATVKDLSAFFKTTGATIRSDLLVLDNQKLIIRTYGGAILAKDNFAGDQPVNYKENINKKLKQAIAKAGVMFIHDGDFILFDAGSTVNQMISLLSNFEYLTIMTNSLSIVNELVSLDNEHTIILAGGVFRKRSASFHNNLSIASQDFAQYQFDYLFMGADGIDEKGKVTTFNDSYHGSIEMSKASKKVILMVDSSKFGRRASNIIFHDIQLIDTIITDSLLSDEYYHKMLELGVNIIKVKV